MDCLLQPVAQSVSAELFERVRAHVYSHLLCLGRHTITGLLSTQGRIHRDWSADYRLYSRDRFDPAVLFDCALREVEAKVGAKEPLVVALDDSILRKRGPRIAGVRWSRDPLGPPFAVNFVRAQRVLQFSAAVVSDRVQARMIPVDFQHAPAPARPKRTATAQELADFKQEQKKCNINRVAAQRLAHLRAKSRHPVVAVCDGRFANRTFLRATAADTKVITRIRKDSALFYPPSEQAATGRRRLYGERAPTPEQLRADEAKPWQRVRGFACGKMHSFKIKRLETVRSPLNGAPACQMVVIAPLAYRLRENSRLLYRQPAYLLCTDPALSLRRLLQFYLWRWDIEVNFRDEKTLLGAGQAQVRCMRSCQRVPAMAVASYALLLLAAANTCQAEDEPLQALFPPPKWRAKKPPRPSTSVLLDHLRFELFAHALKPGSLTGFWEPSHHNQKPSKHPVSLATSLFHMRN